MIEMLVLGCCVDGPEAAGKVPRDSLSNFQCLLSGIDVRGEGTIDLGYWAGRVRRHGGWLFMARDTLGLLFCAQSYLV
jgi:hypothetical protein